MKKIVRYRAKLPELSKEDFYDYDIEDYEEAVEDRKSVFRDYMDENEWLYGSLLKTPGGEPFIVGNVLDYENEYFNTEFWPIVDPETICIGTGIKDDCGKEIFEGDAIRKICSSKPEKHEHCISGMVTEQIIFAEFDEYYDRMGYWECDTNYVKSFKCFNASEFGGPDVSHSTLILGNIHDSSLMKRLYKEKHEQLDKMSCL